MSEGRETAHHFDGLGHLTPAYLDTSGPLSAVLDVRGTLAGDSFGLGNLWGDQGFECCGGRKDPASAARLQFNGG